MFHMYGKTFFVFHLGSNIFNVSETVLSLLLQECFLGKAYARHNRQRKFVNYCKFMTFLPKP